MGAPSGVSELVRCGWAAGTELMTAYHDTEWGVPEHDDRRLFEFLVLEGAQAGLSWSTVLNKRARYREVFDGFDPERIARYDDHRVAELLLDAGIIRNRAKVHATVANAQAWLTLAEEHGSAGTWLWEFVEGRAVQNRWTSMGQVPATSPASDRMNKELKRRGFSFVGTTIMYAFMQACGLVNDHLVTCFRHAECADR